MRRLLLRQLFQQTLPNLGTRHSSVAIIPTPSQPLSKVDRLQRTAPQPVQQTPEHAGLAEVQGVIYPYHLSEKVPLLTCLSPGDRNEELAILSDTIQDEIYDAESVDTLLALIATRYHDLDNSNCFHALKLLHRGWQDGAPLESILSHPAFLLLCNKLFRHSRVLPPAACLSTMFRLLDMGVPHLTPLVYTYLSLVKVHVNDLTLKDAVVLLRVAEKCDRAGAPLVKAVGLLLQRHWISFFSLNDSEILEVLRYVVRHSTWVNEDVQDALVLVLEERAKNTFCSTELTKLADFAGCLKVSQTLMTRAFSRAIRELRNGSLPPATALKLLQDMQPKEPSSSRLKLITTLASQLWQLEPLLAVQLLDLANKDRVSLQAELREGLLSDCPEELRTAVFEALCCNRLAAEAGLWAERYPQECARADSLSSAYLEVVVRRGRLQPRDIQVVTANIVQYHGRGASCIMDEVNLKEIKFREYIQFFLHNIEPSLARSEEFSAEFSLCDFVGDGKVAVVLVRERDKYVNLGSTPSWLVELTSHLLTLLGYRVVLVDLQVCERLLTDERELYTYLSSLLKSSEVSVS